MNANGPVLDATPLRIIRSALTAANTLGSNFPENVHERRFDPSRYLGVACRFTNNPDQAA